MDGFSYSRQNHDPMHNCLDGYPNEDVNETSLMKLKAAPTGFSNPGSGNWRPLRKLKLGLRKKSPSVPT